jgi:cytohesin/brefeldin A-inhibited guanine nucleotide-exchange protein
MGEYEAMQSFINLIHSYHFLPLFKGDMREIEWRVKFFDEQLARILPLVYNHFKALDLSSEIFLIKWFMTLFSNNIEIGMLSRLWDNFLLEGEIYMFKCAIAYIKYF